MTASNLLGYARVVGGNRFIIVLTRTQQKHGGNATTIVLFLALAPRPSCVGAARRRSTGPPVLPPRPLNLQPVNLALMLGPTEPPQETTSTSSPIRAHTPTFVRPKRIANQTWLPPESQGRGCCIARPQTPSGESGERLQQGKGNQPHGCAPSQQLAKSVVLKGMV